MKMLCQPCYTLFRSNFVRYAFTILVTALRALPDQYDTKNQPGQIPKIFIEYSRLSQLLV